MYFKFYNTYTSEYYSTYNTYKLYNTIHMTSYSSHDTYTYTIHNVLHNSKAKALLYLTKTFAVETSYAAVICYVKAHHCNSDTYMKP